MKSDRNDLNEIRAFAGCALVVGCAGVVVGLLIAATAKWGIGAGLLISALATVICSLTLILGISSLIASRKEK